jgi:hypothetical protein
VTAPHLSGTSGAHKVQGEKRTDFATIRLRFDYIVKVSEHPRSPPDDGAGHDVGTAPTRLASINARIHERAKEEFGKCRLMKAGGFEPVALVFDDPLMDHCSSLEVDGDEPPPPRHAVLEEPSNLFLRRCREALHHHRVVGEVVLKSRPAIVGIPVKAGFHVLALAAHSHPIAVATHYTSES